MRAAVTPVREDYFVLEIEREQMTDAGRTEFPAEDAFLSRLRRAGWRLIRHRSRSPLRPWLPAP